MDNEFVTRLFVVSLLILSTAFHEMAHAFTATWLGDPTPGRNGRLTLNPIPHLQPVLTAIALPLLTYLSHWGFMILAQTPINPSRFKHPLRDHALVAVAGPVTNVICAAVLLGVLWIPGIWHSYGPETMTMAALSNAAILNLLMAAFNMMPLPPLDGYWIARAALPLQVRMQTDAFARSPNCWMVAILVGSLVLSRVSIYIELFCNAFLPR